MLDFLRPPDDWLGAVLPVDLTVGADTNAVVAITHLTVYPVGFSFHLTALTREDPGVICEQALSRSRLEGKDREEIYLHLGVEFSDGRRASDPTTWISTHGGLTGHMTMPKQLPPDPRSEVFLSASGHEANDREFSGSAWIWPLPPAGPLAFLCGWPAAGIERASTVIDADRLLEAVDGAEPLWEPSR